MIHPPDETTVLRRLTHWADAQPAVRAAILYSSRADPTARLDPFSDYDVLLAVADVRPFHADDSWLAGYGPLLVVFKNPIGEQDGFESFGFITHYQDGTKIDYTFVPLAYLEWASRQPRLPDDLDDGYRILLDKDGLTAGLPAPTYTAYTPTPPSEAEYRAVIDEFFNDALYVAKHLWRDNLFNVKLSLDHIMKYEDVRRMLEWQAGIACGWRVKNGAHGKGLKNRVDPRTWAELESTYVGAGREENWRALRQTLDLFRKLALDVGGSLGYAYPHEQEWLVRAWIRQVEEG